MSAKWVRTWIPISEDLSKDQRELVARDILEFIKERTEGGRGIPFGESGVASTTKKFPKYSKDYVDSNDFKNAGKSASKIDLTLSGEMLAALDILKIEKNRIMIGFERGSDENARADGNVRGTYGSNSEDPNKARNFMGLTQKDLDRIERRAKKEVE